MFQKGIDGFMWSPNYIYNISIIVIDTFILVMYLGGKKVLLMYGTAR